MAPGRYCLDWWCVSLLLSGVVYAQWTCNQFWNLWGCGLVLWAATPTSIHQGYLSGEAFASRPPGGVVPGLPFLFLVLWACFCNFQLSYHPFPGPLTLFLAFFLCNRVHSSSEFDTSFCHTEAASSPLSYQEVDLYSGVTVWLGIELHIGHNFLRGDCGLVCSPCSEQDCPCTQLWISTFSSRVCGDTTWCCLGRIDQTVPALPVDTDLFKHSPNCIPFYEEKAHCICDS